MARSARGVIHARIPLTLEPDRRPLTMGHIIAGEIHRMVVAHAGQTSICDNRKCSV